MSICRRKVHNLTLAPVVNIVAVKAIEAIEPMNAWHRSELIQLSGKQQIDGEDEVFEHPSKNITILIARQYKTRIRFYHR